MKASYYIASEGETIKCAEVELEGEDLVDIAEKAAEHEWFHCDGGEWMCMRCAVTLNLVQEGCDVGEYTVSILPVFKGTLPKGSVATGVIKNGQV